MSYDDDDFEPSAPTATEAVQTVTVSLELSQEALLDAVAEKLAARAWSAQTYGSRGDDDLKSRATKMATAAIARRVQELAGDLISSQVEKTLEDILANGFPVTDNYGNEKSRKTVRQFALEFLERKDGYDRNTKLEQLTKAFVDKALADLEPEVKALKAKVKAAYGASADARIKKAIEEAIGL